MELKIDQFGLAGWIYIHQTRVTSLHYVYVVFFFLKKRESERDSDP